jgi:hypothetical protein
LMRQLLPKTPKANVGPYLGRQPSSIADRAACFKDGCVTSNRVGAKVQLSNVPTGSSFRHVFPLAREIGFDRRRRSNRPGNSQAPESQGSFLRDHTLERGV